MIFEDLFQLNYSVPFQPTEPWANSPIFFSMFTLGPMTELLQLASCLVLTAPQLALGIK